MRTTIDLPADLHRAAAMLARDRGQTLSRTVADLLRAALAGGSRRAEVEFDDETGLPLVRLGRRITAEDVASAQDEA
ncbi:hypothetical protein SAMN05661080_00060 [Modestobacter sp. DSM 44400]|uniref:antitoxin n=1 Tax=Modestobacter sp. DSM 44400 TaxID=1550230 RepID=UPI00089804FA|nr:antitoxin [Modestobacter sp. DSM 44400]SDX47536.1 hypothetical protein SAMN05661080_00060 [Modestobacter sp. DSM 44400]